MSLSQRSAQLTSNTTSIVKGHLKCIEDPISSDNPKGYINFGTAENFLMSSEMQQFLSNNVEVNECDLHYSDLSGGEKLKEIYCQFAKDFLKVDFSPENIVIQNGLSSMCESLAYCLLNPNDKIMVFAPYYTGFDFDFGLRFSGQIVPVDLDSDDDYYHHSSKLEEAYQKHDNVKALIICHPHNPTGRILSDEEISSIITWAKQKDIHLISDEIYALSMIEPQKPFKSFCHPDFESYDKLHHMYGMAKDFGLGGFKVGFFHTKDQELLERMQATSYFHCISTITQNAVIKIFSDKEFLNSYIQTNQKKLRSAFKQLKDALPKLKTPEAGLYSYSKISDDETGDFDKFLDEFKVNILPGSSFHDKNLGHFRICFAKGELSTSEFITRMKDYLNT